MLPGVVMAKGGEVFHMLYQLSELEEPKLVQLYLSSGALVQLFLLSGATVSAGMLVFRDPS